MTFDDGDISFDPNFFQFMLEEMLGEVRDLLTSTALPHGLMISMPIVSCFFFQNTFLYSRPRLTVLRVAAAHFELKIFWDLVKGRLFATLDSEKEARKSDTAVLTYNFDDE
jgi:hypothetical protein